MRGSAQGGAARSDRTRAREDPHEQLQEAKFDLLDFTTGLASEALTKAKLHWSIALELLTTGRYDVKGEISKLVKSKVSPKYQRLWAARGSLADNAQYERNEAELNRVKGLNKPVIGRLKYLGVSSLSDGKATMVANITSIKVSLKKAKKDLNAFLTDCDDEFPDYDGVKFIDKDDLYRGEKDTERIKKDKKNGIATYKAHELYWWNAALCSHFTKAIESKVKKSKHSGAKLTKSRCDELLSKYKTLRGTLELRDHELPVAKAELVKVQHIEAMEKKYDLSYLLAEHLPEAGRVKFLAEKRARGWRVR